MAAGLPPIRNLSEDGSRAFFQTPDPLVSRDVNRKMDMYEWHDGKIALLSDGRSRDGSFYFGNSADGRDAFFGTTANSVASDYDLGDVDIYDARVGGGFAAPAPPAGVCVGEACQGTPSGTPSARSVKAARSDPRKPRKRRRRGTARPRQGTARTRRARRALAACATTLTVAARCRNEPAG